MHEKSDWDRHWKSTARLMGVYEFLQKEQLKRYLELIGNRLDKKSRILEIGCGSGYLTRSLCRRFNCSAVLVDSSKEAHRLYKRHANNRGIEFRHMDAFDLSDKNEFDLVFSDGVIEHFVGKKQERLIRIHRNAAKKGGCVVLFVPCKSKRYELFKKVQQMAGLWNYGFERPYTKTEFEQLLRENDLAPEKFSRGFWEIGAVATKK